LFKIVFGPMPCFSTVCNANIVHFVNFSQQLCYDFAKKT
jgi:hypothetical protein